MLLWSKGVVTTICSESNFKQTLQIKCNDELRFAINYPILTGECTIGDEVLFNITAVELKLGTGGYDFVIANLTSPPLKRSLTKEHIIKNRYTPLQFAIHSGEEVNIGNQKDKLMADTLMSIPVLIISLHSMLPIIALYLKQQNPNSNIVYVMTDATSLPIWLSDHVGTLMEQKLINGNITCGQSFGGEIEAVNKFSGLLLAKERYEADYIIVGPGPGSVGTGSEWGFSAIEVGELIHAVSILAGIPVVVPRISFSDQRSRHIGISHHLMTTLSKACLATAYFPLPRFADDRYQYIQNQIDNLELETKHKIEWLDPESLNYIREILQGYKKKIATMGRGIDEDPSFFQGVCAAANFVTMV